MLVEAFIEYAQQPGFLYQLTTTLFVYYSIQIVRFYYIRHKRYQIFKYYGLPGPEPSILDGHTSVYYKDKKLYEVSEDFHKKYGPTWWSFQGDYPAITTSDPALIRHVFLEDNETFSDRTRPFMEIKLSDGILFCARPKWKFFRRILAAPFNRFTNRGQASVQFIEDSIQLMIKYIDDKIETAKVANKRADINMYDLMKSNALYIISELAIKLPIRVQEYEPNVVALDNYLTKTDGFFFKLTIKFPCLKEFLTWLVDKVQINGYMSVVYSALEKRIEESKAKFEEDVKRGNVRPSEDEPILDMMMRLMHNNQITKRELFGNAEALLFAGYDTTSTTLIYTLWLLAKHQDIQEKLKTELQTHGTNSKYLEQVLNESMRLYPVVVSFTTRLASKSTRFNDVVIPQETLMIYNAWIMHRDPTYWEKPEKFDPDRFAEGRTIDPIYFAPFGMGERKCLGAKLAMLQMKIILTELIMRYRLILNSPQELKLVSCGFVLTKPAEEVKIELQKRDLNNN